MPKIKDKMYKIRHPFSFVSLEFLCSLHKIGVKFTCTLYNFFKLMFNI